ncbi:MAG: hypothetical protein JW940_36940 [Polyangiaceae bacterium]|nr:hypothetical protein [Polyangiaceae bacterium]
MKRLVLLCSVGIGLLAISSRVQAGESPGGSDSEGDSSEAGASSDQGAGAEPSDDAPAPRARHKRKHRQERGPQADQRPKDSEQFGHAGQFSLRAGLVGGMRVIVRYEHSPFCADPTEDRVGEERTLCGHASPLALDLGAGFSAIDGFEPFFWARLGLTGESQTDTQPLVVLGGGARLYAMSDSAFKVLIEPAFGIELEGGGDTPAWHQPVRGETDYRTDFLFHLAAGPHYDFTKNFGAYLDAGVTLGILRALHGTMEAQLGVQGRYP